MFCNRFYVFLLRASLIPWSSSRPSPLKGRKFFFKIFCPGSRTGAGGAPGDRCFSVFNPYDTFYHTAISMFIILLAEALTSPQNVSPGAPGDTLAPKWRKGRKGRGTIRGLHYKREITILAKHTKTHSRLFPMRRNITKFPLAVVFLLYASPFIYSQRVFFIWWMNHLPCKFQCT